MMNNYLSFLLLFYHVLSCCGGDGGYLDLSELNSVQYNVEILDTPVSDIMESEEGEGSRTMSLTMVNKEGQRYRCSLPDIPEKAEKEEGEEETVPDIAQLLSPLEDGPCLYKTKDWWTYEVCYKRSVRQYHVENDKAVGDIMVLGVHDIAKDSYEPRNTTFLPQWYNNGTKCDLTGAPRQTELRFVCNEAAVQDFIGDIFEPQSCEYTIVIHTSRLCSVPWLRPVADPTPLPIVCQPLLLPDQMDKYQAYLEKKKLADKLAAKKKQAEKTAELAKSLGGSHVGDGVGGLDGLLSSMGDNMADNLVSEISSLLDKAMAGENAGGVKVFDLRGNEKKKDNEERDDETDTNIKPSSKVTAEKQSPDGWNLVNPKQSPPSSAELRTLIETRNQLWRKIHEEKKLVKKYTSQLHDTATFLANEKQDTFRSDKVVERLEFQKKTIEKVLVKSRVTVTELESQAKDVAHKIVAAQSKIKVNMEQEQLTWISRLTQMETLHEDETEILKLLMDIAIDFKKVTNEWLERIDDYFRVSKRIVDDKYPSEKMEKHQKMLKFWEPFLPSREEVLFHMAEQAEVPEDIPKLAMSDLSNAAKFRDVVKDNVREEFQDILKEVSEELDIPDGDVDKDEAMKAMSDTLDNLMTKLAGAGEKIDKVQRVVDDMKKLSGDKDATDELLSLKRDNKPSVKKDLSRQFSTREEEDEDDDYDDIDEFSDEVVNSAVDALKEAESDVARLEQEMEELKSKDIENVKVSVTNMSPDLGSDEDTEKVVKKLEDTIKDKLTKLGLDTGGRPIEVKLITTQIPEGLEAEGSDDAQVQGMFYNMMTGNIQGYEDINNQRKFESNYKFSWDENSIADIDKKLEEYGGFSYVSDQSDEVTNDNQVITEVDNDNEDTTQDIPLEFLQTFQVGEKRQRPSSEHSKIDVNSEGDIVYDYEEVIDDNAEESNNGDTRANMEAKDEL